MLRTITDKVDLFFFDGRIQITDLPEIARLMHDRTVFVTDDYVRQEKGVANVQILTPLVPNHVLIPSGAGASTLAALVPFQSQAA